MPWYWEWEQNLFTTFCCLCVCFYAIFLSVKFSGLLREHRFWAPVGWIAGEVFSLGRNGIVWGPILDPNHDWTKSLPLNLKHERNFRGFMIENAGVCSLWHFYYPYSFQLHPERCDVICWVFSPIFVYTYCEFSQYWGFQIATMNTTRRWFLD